MAVSLTLYFALLLLAPAVFALLVAALGFARQPIPWLVGVCAALGVALPLIGLIVLNLANSSGAPLQITLLGAQGPKVLGALAYRVDAIGYYAAYGLLVVVTPLLLWLAWRGKFSTSSSPAEALPVEAPAAPDVVADEDAQSEEAQGAGTSVASARPLLATEQWAGVALTLGLLSVALSVVFADNILWLGVSWLVAAALAWALGELGSELSGLDWLSLALMVAGPVLWVGTMYLAVNPTGFTRISDLMGLGSVGAGNALLVTAAVVVAAGAYPLNGWVRRRAIVSPPIGVAAVALAALPIALFAGARTYSAFQNTVSLLPTVGTVTPPITIGLLWVILGALTVAICGVQALGKRDARSLIAFLAAAQVGWGLIALGVSRPASILGFVILLATMIFGLAAVIASSVAGGTLAPDIEADGAAAHPFGADLRPANVVVWLIGALTLIGAPLFGGFVAQQMISTGAVKSAQIVIPLVGLAWAGDALLALALLRAVAPAFAASVNEPLAEEALADKSDAEDDSTEEAAAAAENAVEVEIAPTSAPTTMARPALLTWVEAPGAICALLALLIGAVPTLLLNAGAFAAAESLTQPGMVAAIAKYSATGYNLTPGQWLPGLVWIAALALGLILAIPLLRSRTRPGEVYLAGETATAGAGEVAAREIASLAAPRDAWSDLRSTIESGWTTPGRRQLLDEFEGAPETEEADVAAETDMLELDTDAEAPDLTDEEGASREHVSNAGEQ
jgi:formate hydrogenlyase subunit 3/multisubunit Na+/H+ antiporter MnhD subunit